MSYVLYFEICSSPCCDLSRALNAWKVLELLIPSHRRLSPSFFAAILIQTDVSQLLFRSLCPPLDSLVKSPPAAEVLVLPTHNHPLRRWWRSVSSLLSPSITISLNPPWCLGVWLQRLSGRKWPNLLLDEWNSCLRKSRLTLQPWMAPSGR